MRIGSLASFCALGVIMPVLIWHVKNPTSWQRVGYGVVISLSVISLGLHVINLRLQRLTLWQLRHPRRAWWMAWRGRQIVAQYDMWLAEMVQQAQQEVEDAHMGHKE